ncbi:MAG TPA: hypothetical protein VKE74_23555, partial [Gemmataceae bacterium]|nr:hypothetical protein [Gemmataceae bacterium]
MPTEILPQVGRCPAIGKDVTCELSTLSHSQRDRAPAAGRPRQSRRRLATVARAEVVHNGKVAATAALSDDKL